MYVTLHGDAPYRIEAADCLASETVLKGSVAITSEEAAAHTEWMCDAGEMTWDLTIDKQIAFNVGYGASKPLRDAEAFAMYWHAEGMKMLQYEGKIIRVIDTDSRAFTGIPVAYPSEYGYHEFGHDEENIKLQDYQLFESDI